MPTARNFEDAQQAHQSARARLLTAPAPMNPRNTGFVVTAKQHAITSRRRPASLPHDEHPCPDQHTKQLKHINTDVVHANDRCTRATKPRPFLGREVIPPTLSRLRTVAPNRLLRRVRIQGELWRTGDDIIQLCIGDVNCSPREASP